MGFPSLRNKALVVVKTHWLGVCTRWTLLGHVQTGQVGFPLWLNKTGKLVEKFGSATIHVVCGLAQPSYFMGHILEEPHEHADVSTYLGSPRRVVLCQRHGGWGATGAMLLADGKRPLRYTNNPSEQHST